MTKGPRGFTGVSLRIIATAAVMFGWWGIAAFSAFELAIAWFLFVVTVPLIGGTRVPAAVLLSAGLVAFALGVFNGLISASLIGLAVSLGLFWTAGLCVALGARAGARRGEKLVRS